MYLNLEHGLKAAYSYDATDNRLSRIEGATVSTTVPSTSNKISAVSGDSYTYDAAGNITSIDVNDYTWNAAGQLEEVEISSATVGEYTYDSQNHRTKKVASSVTTHYVYGLNGVLYGEYDNTGALVREYGATALGIYDASAITTCSLTCISGGGL